MGMLNFRKSLSYLWHLNWYLNAPGQMPLTSDLDQYLPLPNLRCAKIFWPNRYCWDRGKRKLDLMERELSRFAPVERYDVAAKGFEWHSKGGFPVPDEIRTLIGKPRNPKNPYDIRGELFEVAVNGHVIRCAYDYSDYPVISTKIMNEVDLYFKCTAPHESLPSKVIRIGYFSKNATLLSKARLRMFTNSLKKDIDVYGRFGSWTDSQRFRQIILNSLRESSLNFIGGFGVRIYPSYLKELMRAKIALDVPGQGPISHRLTEAMALGALVVSTKPACVFPEEIIDGTHYVAIKSDGRDVVEICAAFLEDEHRRQTIANEAMRFFDRNFSPQSMARRILRAVAQLSC
jgi:glycosyltransferase involved in cell wall biosynthesis